MIEVEAFTGEPGDQWQEDIQPLFRGNNSGNFADGLKLLCAALADQARQFYICSPFGHAPFQPGQRILELAGHAVEGTCQCADLILRCDRSARAEIARGDLLRNCGEGLNRAG